MTPTDEIIQLFRDHGSDAYFGEDVSQEEHALQAAHLAASQGASNTLVAASLLHDIGHLLAGYKEDAAQHGIDDAHEDVGYRWLQQHFGDSVAEPVRLHVSAKRYLCAVDTDYLSGLSPASVLSLGLQGGPFTAGEIQEFESNPYFAEAVRLRKWDDEAKIPGLPVPGIEQYREILESAALHNSAMESPK